MSDHYTLLGVGRGATTEEIAIAYRRLARQRHQEMGAAADLGALSLAYRILSSPDRRREYDRGLQDLAGAYLPPDPAQPTEAERSYQAGLEAMERQGYQEAAGLFTRAIELSPRTAHFHSHLGLALGMFRDRLAEAERCCKRAVGLDPDNPELFYNLGFLYQRHNLNDAAQEAFSKAQEARSIRQARLRPAGGGVIVVGASGESSAGDLLRELETLESDFAGREPAVPAASQESASRTVDNADDLLRELETIESQVNGQEMQPEAAGQAPPTATAPDEPVSVDDLLRELAEMEKQVSRAEAEEPLAPPQSGFVAQAEAAFTPVLPEADIYQETRIDESDLAAQAGQLLEQEPRPPSEPLPVQQAAPVPDAPQSQSLPEESTPVALAADDGPLRLETAAIEQELPPVPGPAPISEPAQAEPVPTLLRDNGHGEPVDPDVQKKMRQLEALESEMEEELARIRLQRQKLLGTAI